MLFKQIFAQEAKLPGQIC